MEIKKMKERKMGMKGRFPKLGVSPQTKKYSFCLISTGNIKITVIIIKSRGNVFRKSCSRSLAVEGKNKTLQREHTGRCTKK